MVLTVERGDGGLGVSNGSRDREVKRFNLEVELRGLA